jgi:hypothetical protein
VTSSSSISFGFIASARTIAARCCWPPESRDLLAQELDPALVDRLEQIDAAQQGGLARARCSDQADDLVLSELEVDALENLDGEGLVQVLDSQEGGRRIHLAPPSAS